ncbi:hypothetical protein [Parvicella tangerina]|uniref:Uncharacterized protein n=1 Tax=Parvicella tangerina TaxID=2829795 RepID=A0A916JLA3_9FLAO|nr:hypothetical protein [Parvicella tangerina]CAG5079769.1 hypothetical protein CRYO30217_01057 [Parvicella tangerina]
MKKFIIFCIGSILVLLLLAIAFENTIIFNSSTSGASKFYRILNDNDSQEIPIFGSSRAKRNYMPSVLGEHYYNYGVEGVQDNVVLFFLEEELAKDRETPIIINYDLDGVNSVIGDIKNYLPFLSNPKVVALVKKDMKPHYYVPYAAYFGHFEAYVKDYLNESLQQTEVADQGAALLKGAVDEATFKKYVKDRDNSTLVVKHDAELYAKYLELCKSTDRKVLFVVSPNHVSYTNSIQNNEENLKFFNELKAIDNVTVINFSSVIYPDKNFFNTTHLNYLGAEVFSYELKDSLAKYL